MTKLYRAAAYTFTRPNDTTAYASADLVANSTTAGSVVPISISVAKGGARIVSLKLQKSGTTVTNATFSLHVFGTTPTVANGDNGAISYTISDRIAIVPFPIMTAGTDVGQTFLNAGDSGFTQPLWVMDTDGMVFGLLEAKAAYTPTANETFTLSATIEKFY